jgi:hypothetical protein
MTAMFQSGERLTMLSPTRCVVTDKCWADRGQHHRGELSQPPTPTLSITLLRASPARTNPMDRTYRPAGQISNRPLDKRTAIQPQSSSLMAGRHRHTEHKTRISFGIPQLEKEGLLTSGWQGSATPRQRRSTGAGPGSRRPKAKPQARS